MEGNHRKMKHKLEMERADQRPQLLPTPEATEIRTDLRQSQ